jgi:ABC-2 type transport system ATP-binding protein
MRGLTKRYDNGFLALDGLDLDVPDGAFFGLLGPNGAGKTTLISAVCNLIRVTAGEIAVFGHHHGTLPARSLIGLAEQDVNLDRFLDVEETLLYHGGYYGMDRAYARRRAGEMMDVFDLRAKADVRAPMLSGGMRRRLLLARALMHEPRLVILDEPTAGVDFELRLELWAYIRRLHCEGTTILLTTHYLEEAEELCKEIALIRGGRLIAREQAAAAQQGDLLAELLGLFEVVRGEQDRRPLAVQAADVGPQLEAQLEVHAGGRLVEDDQPRLVHERAREQQAPAHAARQHRRADVGLRAQVEDVHHLGRAVARVRAVHPVVAAVVEQRLLDVEEAVEVDVLLGQADQAPRLHRVVPVAEHVRLAAGRADQVADGADQRGLAGAVGPEQPEELTGPDLEVEAVEREEAVVVALGQSAEFQGEHADHDMRRRL